MGCGALFERRGCIAQAGGGLQLKGLSGPAARLCRKPQGMQVRSEVAVALSCGHSGHKGNSAIGKPAGLQVVGGVQQQQQQQ